PGAPQWGQGACLGALERYVWWRGGRTVNMPASAGQRDLGGNLGMVQIRVTLAPPRFGVGSCFAQRGSARIGAPRDRPKCYPKSGVFEPCHFLNRRSQVRILPGVVRATLLSVSWQTARRSTFRPPSSKLPLRRPEKRPASLDLH